MRTKLTPKEAAINDMRAAGIIKRGFDFLAVERSVCGRKVFDGRLKLKGE